MDSAFLHARSLYEFFTTTEKAIERNKQNHRRRLTWRDYSSHGRQDSQKYGKFMKPLHGRVMHVEEERTGLDEIKREVANFATDILKLWDSFSRKPDLVPYAGLLAQFREKAICEANKVARQYTS